MWNKELNINITTEMIQDLKHQHGFDYATNIEEKLINLLKIQQRKKKLEKVCGVIMEEKQK